MAENLLKNLTINESWHNADDFQPTDPLLRNWLLNTGSLTERLQANCLRFEVEVLNQQTAEISPDEVQYLYGQFGAVPQDTQVREVFLKGNDETWVFARSLLPVNFLNDEMSGLMRLGNKPLGKIIFNDPRFQRQSFQLVKCPVSGLTQEKLGLRDNQLDLWGRRSLFSFKTYHIMVAEIFLPGSPAYANL